MTDAGYTERIAFVVELAKHLHAYGTTAQRLEGALVSVAQQLGLHCEPWINRAIILQHLYAPAMWSIFQIQDILGMSDTLRRENPHEERINFPANPKHYWRYRMHVPLEQLLKEGDFNKELKDYIINSGR